MKPIIKAIWSINDDLETYIPELSHCFAIEVEIDIGVEGFEGCDIYHLMVCNPEYLQRACDSQGISMWGRHMLIVLEYDYNQIKNKIEEYVDTCQGETPTEVSQKLSRMFKWEFEDYKKNQWGQQLS